MPQVRTTRGSLSSIDPRPLALNFDLHKGNMQARVTMIAICNRVMGFGRAVQIRCGANCYQGAATLRHWMGLCCAGTGAV